MAVVRIEIEQRAVVLDGHTFGAAGAYEKLAGVVRFAVDRANPANHAITDLGLAPANARGHVEFWADFYLLRPADPARGNRRLLLDVPNRGRKVALGLFNSTPRVPDPSTPDDFGNGFLMRHGYTVAWCGWQHDVPRRDGLMALTVPAARGNGPAITGLVRCEWRPNTRVTTLPLADRYHIPHPTIDLQDPGARLTVRERREAAAVEVERGAWRFPDASSLTVENGFEPGKIYELVYRAANPPLVGLGFLAVRDTAAWLRCASAADGNPCAETLDRAYAFGVSQSGRFLRHLLHLGLNEDEAGRLARPHRHPGQARRRAAPRRPCLPLRRHPAHAGEPPAARRRPEHGRSGTGAVQRRGLRAAPARGAREPRPVGHRGGRAAREQRAASGGWDGGARRGDRGRVHEDPGCPLPGSHRSAGAPRLRPRAGARHRHRAAAEGRRPVRHLRVRRGRRRQRDRR